MRNPLMKRVPREIKRDIGKYTALFLFITLIIGFVSGFIVSDDTMKSTYDHSFEKYNVEDGHFVLEKKASKKLIEKVEKKDVEVTELFFKDDYMEDGDDIRIFKNRKSVNKAGIWDGRLPRGEGEIALDRIYSVNNKIETGDKVKVGGKEYRVTGKVALSDYSSLFKDNAQFMFDANHFGVGLVTEEGFDRLSDRGLNYCYAWTDNEKTAKGSRDRVKKVRKALIKAAYPKIDEEALMAEVMETGKTPEKLIKEKQNPVKDFIGRDDNQAISFVGEDMGQDKVMIITILYLVMIVLAFIFAITEKSTIEKEAGEVGTLRASGLRRGELLFHYMLVPVIVTLVGAVIGNILGYTLIKNYIDSVYLNSYSLLPFDFMVSREAFVLTTVIPIIMIFIIAVIVIYKELRKPPIDFLRGELTKEKHVSGFALKKGPFLSRFRRRVLIQNIPAYIVMAFGIQIAVILLIFCLGLLPLLDHFKGEIIDSKIAEYQYVLKAPAKTDDKKAEKYQMTALKTEENAKDEITVYGVKRGSRYLEGIKLPKSEKRVLVSSAYADKYGLDKGDKIELAEEFKDDKYNFTIDGIYDYSGQMTVFIERSIFNKVFDRDKGEYTGYFSNVRLKDIPEDDVAAVMTEDDLTIVADQMNDSMSGIFQLFILFGVMIFVIVMYLLSKQIVDKNQKSISMVKILGYNDREITAIYNRNTLLVVALVLIVSIFIANYAFEAIYRAMMRFYAGWMTFYIDPSIFIKIGAIGIVSYLAVHFLQLRHVKKIDMAEALKGME